MKGGRFRARQEGGDPLVPPTVVVPPPLIKLQPRIQAILDKNAEPYIEAYELRQRTFPLEEEKRLIALGFKSPVWVPEGLGTPKKGAKGCEVVFPARDGTTFREVYYNQEELEEVNGNNNSLKLDKVHKQKWAQKARKQRERKEQWVKKFASRK